MAKESSGLAELMCHGDGTVTVATPSTWSPARFVTEPASVMFGGTTGSPNCANRVVAERERRRKKRSRISYFFTTFSLGAAA
jgi:hypothetical protein